MGGNDLAPTTLVREIDNSKITLISFKIGDGLEQNKKLVLYKPPTGWSFTGDGDGFTLISDGMNTAEVTFEKISPLESAAYNEEQQKTYQREVQGLVPEGSDNLAIVSQETNPSGIGGHPTTELIVSYSLFGRPLLMSVFYLNMGDSLLRIKLVCDKRDFIATHQTLHQSLHSWTEK